MTDITAIPAAHSGVVRRHRRNWRQDRNAI